MLTEVNLKVKEMVKYEEFGHIRAPKDIAV